MNNPQQLRRKINEELEKHPFPASIERLNSERQTQLEIQQSYTELLTTATSLPPVLEQRIQEIQKQIDFEHAVHDILQQLINERRQHEMESLTDCQSQYSSVFTQVQQNREQLAAEWGEIQKLSALLADLSANQGLTPEKVRETEGLRMLQRLPIRMDSVAVSELALSPDELWKRMGSAATQHSEPVVPLFDKYPRIQQFLARK